MKEILCQIYLLMQFVLGIDAINKANSGHPGVVMGAAPMAYNLFTKQLHINPAQPSPGLAATTLFFQQVMVPMLLYALLHLSGLKMSAWMRCDFNQWGSKTPRSLWEFGHTAS